jgi:hypothetical protein
MPDVAMEAIEDKVVSLPVYPKLAGRKLLVMDLDETLVHC